MFASLTLIALVASSIPAQAIIRSEPKPAEEPGLLPVCKFEGKTASCCASVGLLTKTSLCVELQVNPNELKVNTALVLNNKKVAQKDLAVGKICAGIPLMPACLNVYWVDVNLEKKTFDACFQASYGKLLSVDFRCIRYENEEFSKNDSKKPNSKGLIHIDV